MNKIDQLVTESSYTPYEIHKIINVLLQDGRSIRPQMMYNYARNGMIVRGEKIFKESLRRITNEEVKSFLVRYCIKNQINVELIESNPDQLELDLEIETSK